MNNRNILPGLVLLVLVSLESCKKEANNANTEIASPVSVNELKPGPIKRYINTSGTAVASKDTEIKSQMAGTYVLQRNPSTGQPYRLGDKVSAGTVIVKFDDKEYLNDISYDIKCKNLEIVKQEFQKQKALYEKGGATLTEVKNSELKVASAELEVENAQFKLDYMNIKAPFSGVIVDLPHYTSNVKLETGKSIVSIMDYSTLYMDINLPENAITSVNPGQKVAITHYSLKNDTLQGTIRELSPAISAETRTFKGKLEINNKDLKIRPGMFVKADIIVENNDNAIIIPKSIIQSRGRSRFVYTLDKNVAKYREITTGIEDKYNVEITDGLKEGDIIIVKGFETLRNDSKVKVER